MRVLAGRLRHQCARNSSRAKRWRILRRSTRRRGSSFQGPTMAEYSFAYLFERFPSFVQTFVYREAMEMVRQEMAPRLISIRQPEDPATVAQSTLAEILYVPEPEVIRCMEVLIASTRGLSKKL